MKFFFQAEKRIEIFQIFFLRILFYVKYLKIFSLILAIWLNWIKACIMFKKINEHCSKRLKNTFKVIKSDMKGSDVIRMSISLRSKFGRIFMSFDLSI